MTNDNPKCPVCLTAQSGAHTCKRAKPRCEHDEKDTWQKREDDRTYNVYEKKLFKDCPFCRSSPAVPQPDSVKCEHRSYIRINDQQMQCDNVGCKKIIFMPLPTAPTEKNEGKAEESKFSQDDFKYYTDTIVRIMKNAICKKGSTPNDAIDELNLFFAEALRQARISALEEAARVAESYPYNPQTGEWISQPTIEEAIRKLKG